jgi:hypothetical protein
MKEAGIINPISQILLSPNHFENKTNLQNLFKSFFT